MFFNANRTLFPWFRWLTMLAMELLASASLAASPQASASQETLPTAGYDEGFFIRSPDDTFLMRPGLQFKFQYILDHRVGNQGELGDVERGFQFRVLRPAIGGHLFTPRLSYLVKLELTFPTFAVLDCYASYVITPDWVIRAGQISDPVAHEIIVGAVRTLCADYSLVGFFLGALPLSYVQGLSLIYGAYGQRALYVEALAHDGANTINTAFTNLNAANKKSDFGLTARMEYKFFGDWDSYYEFTAKNASKRLLVLGMAADFTRGDRRNQLVGGADAQWIIPPHLAFYGTYLFLWSNRQSTPTHPHRFDQGFLIQAGYLLTDNWEIYGRFDPLLVDRAFVPSIDRHLFLEIIAGVNYYLFYQGKAFQRAKLTFEAGYYPHGAVPDLEIIGLLSTNRPIWLARAQLQLVI